MRPTRRYRRNLPHIQEEGRSFFVTFRTRDRQPLLPEARDIVLDCCRHIHERSAILHAAVVMPDHAHLILTPQPGPNGAPVLLDKILQGLKGVSARRINQALGRKGSVWQDESFDHLLRKEESAEAKAAYICENPVRAGLVEKAEDYPWLWRLSEQGVQ